MGRTALLAACALSVCALAQEAPGLGYFNIAGWTLQAEIARSPAARVIGLMGRPSLPENRGMLFVPDGDEPPCLWMKDTPLPLAAAFLDRDGTILGIVEMRPLSLDIHCSPKPGYALEMNAGWFSRRGIAAGARLGGLDAVESGR